MKKKFKKLSLSIETLRNLGESALKEAAGGETEFCSQPCSEVTRACSMCTVACSVCCM